MYAQPRTEIKMFDYRTSWFSVHLVRFSAIVFRLKRWHRVWHQRIMILWLILVCPKTKKPRNRDDFEVLTLFDFYSAEEEGFEPPEPCGSTVFKTAAFDRSAISPAQK